jgi:hypothetical protein
MSGKEIFQLPWPTSRTITGPRVYWESPALVVDYDFEQDDGSIEWTRVTFHDVLAFEYRESACCEAADLDAYNQMVRYLDSGWLEEIRRRWREFLGSQAKEASEQSYAHWRIYFDDAGCIDVIAQSFEIG